VNCQNEFFGWLIVVRFDVMKNQFGHDVNALNGGNPSVSMSTDPLTIGTGHRTKVAGVWSHHYQRLSGCFKVQTKRGPEIRRDISGRECVILAQPTDGANVCALVNLAFVAQVAIIHEKLQIASPRIP
jgi:hypothetical protein